jgi:2,4-dienoyl-CoA reductase-like NADH-dependent reductase (Old Yellow Enzyme family)
MSKVFESTTFAGLTLKNRIFRSATHEGMGDSYGHPLDSLGKLYIKLAEGGVGAIITGFTAVQQNGRAANNMLIFDRDDYIEDYKELLRPLRKFDVPVFLQLAHAGGKSDPALADRDPVAPSSSRIMYPFSRTITRVMSDGEINELIENFVRAIVRAKKAGFEGVQLHGAHGYLLFSFLSPYCNRRTDKWGGDTEGRYRMLGEIVRQARQEAGNYPLLLKISAHEADQRGMTLEESVRLAKMFEESGGDAIEVSCGGFKFGYAVRSAKIPVEGILNLEHNYASLPPAKKKIMALLLPLVLKPVKPLHNYNVEAAAVFKRQLKIPVIVVGGLRKLDDMEKIIVEGKADYLSLCRPLIIEPSLPKRFQEGLQKESKCIDCAYCLTAANNNPLRCYYGKISVGKNTVSNITAQTVK